ncbi:Ig-like domain-containing protein [Clostridium sp. A1-XYC3]|uniref:Ig-like domain-containing protein n=1 Tax=Clostridium tanneri TaxID=3037988 RepID=A0ABU4JWN3_9CLOT|nr:Ig-like domain-containing protein [Clostridium sp. A1-XYC3]MDW8802575.1 Ig-like domain-containing protein [Clostridium sp. A1-XYC3]
MQSVNNIASKNAVQVILKDGADAAKANDKTSYVVKVGDAEVAVTAVTYLPELKKATLTVDFSGKEGEVSVNGVKAVAAIDFKAPELVQVTPVSDRLIDVKFSEKVTEATAGVEANYGIVLKGTASSVAISSVDKVDDSTYRITVAADLLKEGSVYTVSVNNLKTIEDTNSNVMKDIKVGEFTSIKDTTKPTLVSATAVDTNKVEIVMSEELNKTVLPTVVITPYKADGTLDTSKAYTKTVTAADIAGNKVTVNIDDANLLVNGKNYKLTISGGQDLSELAIADDQAKDFVGVSDVVAPTVKDSSYDAKTHKLTVNFSEKMSGLATVGNYKIFDSQTGVEQTGAVITPAVNADATSVTLTITELDTNKDYSLRLNGLTDASKAANPLKANTIVNFKVPAEVVDVTLNSATAGAAGNTVDLVFNTALDKAQAENINNYSIVSLADETKTLKVTKAVYTAPTVDSDTSKVTLTTDYQGEKTDSTPNYKVTVSGLTNLKSDAATASFAGKDKVAPTLQSVKSISQNYIDLNFDENIAETQDATNFGITIIKAGTAEIAGVYGNEVIESISNKTMRLHLTDALTENTTYTITVKNVKDTFGNYLTNASTPADKAVSKNFDAVKDTTAPKLTTVTAVNSAKLVLQFDEEVSAAGVASNYEIKDENDAVVAFGANSTFTVNSEDKTQVIVENKATVEDAVKLVDLFENGKNYTLKISGGVADVAGNAIQANAAQSLSFVGVKDEVAPKLLSATASPVKVTDGIYNTKVVLTFDEEISPAFATTDFVVTNTETFDELTVTNAVLGEDKKTVELTLGTSTSADGKYKVYVKGSIKDVAVDGNIIDSAARVALFNGVDTQAPTLTGMELKGTKADATETTATITLGDLDANNNGTITITGLAAGAKYSTGSVKLSENVEVTFDAVNNDYDVKTPIKVSKDTDPAALTSLVLTVLGGVDGVTTTQLQNESTSKLSLKDAAGNTSTYTIVVQ